MNPIIWNLLIHCRCNRILRYFYLRWIVCSTLYSTLTIECETKQRGTSGQHCSRILTKLQPGPAMKSEECLAVYSEYGGHPLPSSQLKLVWLLTCPVRTITASVKGSNSERHARQTWAMVVAMVTLMNLVLSLHILLAIAISHQTYQHNR